MPVIPRKFTEHKLHVRMEVFHPEWLANPVLVLKKNKTFPCA